MDDLRRRVYGRVPRVSRTVAVAPRVTRALSMRAPLTILRGPRGFGKTTAVVRWLRDRGDDVPTIYLALDRSARRVAEFWPTLAEALTGAGLDIADPGEPGGGAGRAREAVLGALAVHPTPLRLVIDNYHEAGHRDGRAEVDEALLEVVRVNSDLELVALTRGLRSLETTGALSVDLCVLRPTDLAMRAEDVIALAQQYGVELTEDLADHLVTELGGWPAAVRTCIVSAAVAGRAAKVEAAAVDGYIDVLMAEVTSGSLREFLLRTAVPDEFSAAVAEAVVPGGTAMRELRNMRLAGLLQERDTVGGLRYSYPPAIRDALRRVVRERFAHVEREVHVLLMPLAAQEEGPVGVLHHAVQAREWDAALRIIEEEWDTLVTRHQEELMTIAAGFPSDLREGEPRLRVIRRHVPQMTPSVGSTDTVWERADAQFVTGAVQQRWTEMEGTTDEVLVLLQSGVAAVFAGENEAATYAFERVRDHGVHRGDRTARLLGIGGMLTAKAIYGDADRALELLEDPELADAVAGGEDDDVGELVRVGGRIMRAIAAIDAMRPDVHDVLAAMLEPVRRDELWALAVNARAVYDATYGSPEDGARAVGRLRAALRHVRSGSIAESTLATNLVESLVELGELQVAEQVLDRLSHTFVSSSTRAHLLYTQGRDEEAVEVAGSGLGDPRMTARSRLLSELVLAGALHRRGRSTAARQRFARAVQLAFATGLRRPFTQLPPDVFVHLAGGDPAVLALRPMATTSMASVLQVPVAPIGPQVGLSLRELEVLGALRDHPGPAGVAEALGMSVNTAKTHLRHVYRKLGAANRDEAVMLGRGLLAELA